MPDSINDFLDTVMATVQGIGAPDDPGFRRFARVVNGALNQGASKDLISLIEQVGGQLEQVAPDQQEPFLQTLLNLVDVFGVDGDTQILSDIGRPLRAWLQRQVRLTPAYGKTCVSLQQLAGYFIGMHRLADANEILMLFNHIFSGVLEKDATLRTFTGDILKGFANEKIVGVLVEEFRTNAHNQCREAGQGLVILGAVGSEKILPILQESDDKFDRMRFLEIVAEMGPLAAQTMVAQLRGGGPWYFIRNLVQVLGKVGDESQVEVLASLLTHGDGRVRREALDAIYKIGGAKREDLILNMLHLLDDSLQIRAVAMLGNLRSRKALGPLLAMVGGRTRIWDRTRRELDLMICQALGKIGAAEAIPVLVELAEKKGTWGRQSNSRLAAAAQHALTEITGDPNQGNGAGQGGGNGARTPLTGPATAVSGGIQVSDDELPDRIRTEIREHLRRGNTKAAVKILFDNVLVLIQQNRFDEAEALRRSLVAIDPLAFNAILKSGARIEAARNAAIDSEHMAVWQGFYQRLTLNEANGFYYSLKQRHFAPGEALITQGDSSDALYLIDRGCVKNLFQRKGGDIQLDTLEGGDIGGYETFFHNTVATTSLVAAEPVTVSCLNRRTLTQREKAMPHITPKLHDFCLRNLKRSDLWLRKSVDRRTQRRIVLSAPIKLRLPDAQGRGMHIAYRGQLVDISVGGALVRAGLSRNDRARMLVGHPVLLELADPLAEIVAPARRDAVIVALRPHLFNEHFLQIQFIDKIKLGDFQKIEDLLEVQ